MEIIEFLKIDSSRLNADMVVDKIEEDPDRFEEVWKLALRDESPLSMRASRALWLFARKHPYYLEPYVPDLIRSLHILKSEGVRRNIINMLTFIDIPEEHLGELFDLSLGVLESSSESIANKANSMTVLYNIQIPADSSAIERRALILLGKLYRDLR